MNRCSVGVRRRWYWEDSSRGPQCVIPEARFAMTIPNRNPASFSLLNDPALG